MNQPTAIVVGTGRSGTSFVAKVCHEELGICMGHYLKQANVCNPKGFYEDLLSHGMMELAISGAISVEEYQFNLLKSHENCKHWGFKDPRFLELPISSMIQLVPQLIIRTWRPLKDTVVSWQRKELLRGHITPTEPQRASFEQLCLNRETLMDTKLKYFNVLTVRMDKQVSKAELMEAIRSHLCLD